VGLEEAPQEVKDHLREDIEKIDAPQAQGDV
jgi:hypothetical protein